MGNPAATAVTNFSHYTAIDDLIGLAREEATTLVSADPQLAAHPALRAAIDEFLGVQAEYLDKT